VDRRRLVERLADARRDALDQGPQGAPDRQGVFEEPGLRRWKGTAAAARLTRNRLLWLAHMKRCARLPRRRRWRSVKARRPLLRRCSGIRIDLVRRTRRTKVPRGLDRSLGAFGDMACQPQGVGKLPCLCRMRVAVDAVGMEGLDEAA
jgi:hypothetical protein